jgi:hypothetical protein
MEDVLKHRVEENIWILEGRGGRHKRMLRNMGLIDLHNLYPSPSITIMITSRKKRYRRQIALAWETICMIYEKS